MLEPGADAPSTSLGGVNVPGSAASAQAAALCTERWTCPTHAVETCPPDTDANWSGSCSNRGACTGGWLVWGWLAVLMPGGELFSSVRVVTMTVKLGSGEGVLGGAASKDMPGEGVALCDKDCRVGGSAFPAA
eukprot:scaffold37675_cov27-Tisochrysis_lutea.AAC.4